MSIIRDTIASIDRTERRVIAAVSAAVIVVTSVAPLVGAATAARDGVIWIGRQFLSPGDLSVYLASIGQAKGGVLLAENLFTTEPVAPVFNVLWTAVGLLARIADLTPLAAYHAARVALIPVLAASAYLGIAYFLKEKRLRVGAFVLFMIGSGMGLHAAPFLRAAAPSASGYAWPIDMWVAESNAFMTMSYSPHFVASFALIIAAAVLLLVSYESGRMRHAVIAGLAALLLFQFHPFHAPSLYAVGAAAAIAARSATRRLPWRQYAAFVALSAPAVAYHYFLTHSDEVARSLTALNLTITPPLPYVIAGFGLFAVLWPFGWRVAAGSGAVAPLRLRMLLAWAAAHYLAVYAPISFQRRMLEGLQFPLVVLAVPALAWAYDRVARSKAFGPAFATSYGLLLAAALFLPSTVSTVMRNVDAYADTSDAMFYMTADEAAAMEWLAAHSDGAVVLAEPDEANMIPGMTGARVYAGHWAATVDIGRKTESARSFFAGTLDRDAFLAENGITHVYVGPAGRPRIGLPLDGEAVLRKVFDETGVAIYEVRAPDGRETARP